MSLISLVNNNIYINQTLLKKVENGCKWSIAHVKDTSKSITTTAMIIMPFLIMTQPAALMLMKGVQGKKSLDSHFMVISIQTIARRKAILKVC